MVEGMDQSDGAEFLGKAIDALHDIPVVRAEGAALDEDGVRDPDPFHVVDQPLDGGRLARDRDPGGRRGATLRSLSTAPDVDVRIDDPGHGYAQGRPSVGWLAYRCMPTTRRAPASGESRTAKWG